MTEEQDKVWYACYGSNILEERFLCYIKGGQPEGATKCYKGCTDKSLPIDKKKFIFNMQLYFAKESKTWQCGGVAFVKTTIESDVQTLGRMYLITKEQLKDVAKQENSKEEQPNINYETAIDRGSLIIFEKSWYGNLIYLGTQSGFPIFTLTHEHDNQRLIKPSFQYITAIGKGIKETYNLALMEIVNYFTSKEGISNNYSEDELMSKLNAV